MIFIFEIILLRRSNSYFKLYSKYHSINKDSKDYMYVFYNRMGYIFQNCDSVKRQNKLYINFYLILRLTLQFYNFPCKWLFLILR